MPRAPKKCAGCETRVVGKTHCPACQPIGWKSGGYSRTSTTEHKAWRLEVLNRDHWWCAIRGPGCTGRTKTADHIVPVAFGGAEFDADNGQAACDVCHKVKTNREAIQGRKGPSPLPAPIPPSRGGAAHSAVYGCPRFRPRPHDVALHAPAGALTTI